MTVKFPNNNASILWAFNPNYIKITDTTKKGQTVSVVFTNSDNSADTHTIKVALDGYGVAEAYVSNILQLFFTGDRFDNDNRLAHVTIKVGDSTTKNVSVVWGCLELGDRFSSYGAFVTDGSKAWHEAHLTYFKNFPFTFNLLTVANSVVRYRKDTDAIYTNYGDTVTEDAMDEVDASNYVFTRELVFRQDILESGSIKESSAFDTSFDYTFRTPKDTTVITKIHINESKEGCYLRWIDRFGFVQYYLFDNGDLTLKTSQSDYAVEDTRVYANMRFAGHGRHISVDTERQIKICASNLDEESLLRVESIVSSPIVDRYVGTTKAGEELWMPVSVESGSYTYPSSKPNLRDLEITINLPKRITQTL